MVQWSRSSLGGNFFFFVHFVSLVLLCFDFFFHRIVSL